MPTVQRVLRDVAAVAFARPRRRRVRAGGHRSATSRVPGRRSRVARADARGTPATDRARRGPGCAEPPRRPRSRRGAGRRPDRRVFAPGSADAAAAAGPVTAVRPGTRDLQPRPPRLHRAREPLLRSLLRHVPGSRRVPGQTTATSLPRRDRPPIRPSSSPRTPRTSPGRSARGGSRPRRTRRGGPG